MHLDRLGGLRGSGGGQLVKRKTPERRIFPSLTDPLADAATLGLQRRATIVRQIEMIAVTADAASCSQEDIIMLGKFPDYRIPAMWFDRRAQRNLSQ